MKTFSRSAVHWSNSIVHRWRFSRLNTALKHCFMRNSIRRIHPTLLTLPALAQAPAKARNTISAPDLLGHINTLPSDDHLTIRTHRRCQAVSS
jgi:hypothetical protein